MATLPGAITTFGRQFRPQAAFVAQRLRRLLVRWAALRRERLELAELDDRMLRDIGIDRITARREVDRPFWEGRDRPGRRWR
jgi:uncharacterized protein YjiS (DUF1127 family)